MLIPMTRLQLYVAGSAFFANVVLLRAYYERPNFYSAAVYISQSTGSLLFLINLGFIVTASIGYGLQRLFYGSLRAIETEQLYDKAWFAVSETLLAMTIFRDDIGVWFFAMFLLLLAGKVWQWIGEGRVELLEQQPPANPRLFHTRLMSSLVISVAFDVLMTQYCVDAILQQKRPGVMVMFGFEYVLLAIASVSTLMRYALSLVELVVIRRQETARDEARRLAREQAQQQTSTEGEAANAAAEEEEDEDEDVPGWEEKGRWVFYLDLATDFIKSVVYVGFFIILMAFYGIPIHIMRDLFMTLRSFFKRVSDFRQYRNATRDMNARYPDATAEELERENTCIVCREEMRPWVEPGEGGVQPGRRVDERQRPKKLPCGHILHFSCLRSWLERQQVCPTCRRPVLSAPVENRQNNQMNQNQQDLLNPQNAEGVRGLEGVQNLREQLRNQLRGVQAGQQGPLAQQGHQHGNQPANGANGPGGNMRVYNFGPIRIALGRLPIPQGDGNIANNNGIAGLAQQVAQNQGQHQTFDQAQIQRQVENAFTNLNLPTLPTAQDIAPVSSLPHHPSDIQSDILRLQQNIIDAVRQLNHQHAQLEYIHALLAELNRLQQASGIMAGNGQELPIIAPLNPAFAYAPVVPQAYFPGGPVLRQGDARLPEGVVLPEGWTLRPMTLAQQPGNDQPPPTSQPTSSGFGGSSAPPLPADSTSTLPPSSGENQGDSSTQRPESSGVPSGSSVADSSTSKHAEASSLESSWSFGNVTGTNEAEGSSSAVARSGSEGQNATRRTVTVEDAEDNGE